MRIGIANNRIGVRTIELVGIEDPKQLANAVRFRAQEALPIPIDEAVLDFQVLDEGVNAEGQPARRVLLVVAYRDLVDGYARACRLAGLRLAGIDLEAFALAAGARARGRHGRPERPQRARRGRDRLGAEHPRRLGRLHLRVHARARLGRRRADAAARLGRSTWSSTRPSA